MNAKLFREWKFNFTNVDFWHFSIPYQIGNDKKKKALVVFWIKGEVKVVEEKLYWVLSYKIQ